MAKPFTFDFMFQEHYQTCSSRAQGTKSVSLKLEILFHAYLDNGRVRFFSSICSFMVRERPILFVHGSGTTHFVRYFSIVQKQIDFVRFGFSVFFFTYFVNFFTERSFSKIVRSIKKGRFFKCS